MQNIPDLPQGLTFSDGLVYGSRPTHPGLFEIKYHNPKRKNAISTGTQKKFAQLVNAANENDEIKVILVYGSQNMFSSGNDISMFAGIGPSEIEKATKEAVLVGVRDFIGSIMNSKKPTIMFVRGRCLGMTFTIMSNADFVYCTEDASFQTPFMRSFQSPEGCSTFTFPEQFGTRLANEILLCDKVVSADLALKTGFVNQILPKNKF